jgi:hypothetical protein
MVTIWLNQKLSTLITGRLDCTRYYTFSIPKDEDFRLDVSGVRYIARKKCQCFHR